VFASRRVEPDRPIVVGLAGTDLYADLPDDPTARAAIDIADRLVVLQDAAIERLAAIGAALGAKAHVVYQSVEPPLPERAQPSEESPGTQFVVVVLAHLRDVKDPLLAARAARQLPEASKVKVVHAGHAHDDEWRDRALAEEEHNDRYHWIGEIDRAEALGLLASATVLACTSRLEGGANVVTEAIALGVPVVGTSIEGNWGLLGASYPGLVPVGDAEALATWLHTLETSGGALADLNRRVQARQIITQPATERAAWNSVMSHFALS
jgi:glycosyltransferase involved in cell wall biosynthesis